eukprot:1575079-Amphidinium_carterae.1
MNVPERRARCDRKVVGKDRTLVKSEDSSRGARADAASGFKRSPPRRGRRIEDQALPARDKGQRRRHTLHPPTLKALTAAQIHASPIDVLSPPTFSAADRFGGG